MSTFNLKAPHVSCIYYLYVSGGLTATELCEVCDEDKGGISRSIESLQNDGYIIKSLDSVKRYKSPLMLTEKGKQVGEFLCEKIDSVLLEASQGISNEDRACLYKGLGIISKNLEDLAKKQEKLK
jgi:DNA-binding MarR family transcriptional regulator